MSPATPRSTCPAPPLLASLPAKECFNHKPASLVQLANLRPQLDSDMNLDPILKVNWHLACKWTETSRYEVHSRDEAESLYNAITDTDHGVLPWIRTHW